MFWCIYGSRLVKRVCFCGFKRKKGDLINFVLRPCLCLRRNYSFPYMERTFLKVDTPCLFTVLPGRVQKNCFLSGRQKIVSFHYAQIRQCRKSDSRVFAMILGCLFLFWICLSVNLPRSVWSYAFQMSWARTPRWLRLKHTSISQSYFPLRGKNL